MTGPSGHQYHRGRSRHRRHDITTVHRSTPGGRPAIRADHRCDAAVGRVVSAHVWGSYSRSVGSRRSAAVVSHPAIQALGLALGVRRLSSLSAAPYRSSLRLRWLDTHRSTIYDLRSTIYNLQSTQLGTYVCVIGPRRGRVSEHAAASPVGSPRSAALTPTQLPSPPRRPPLRPPRRPPRRLLPWPPPPPPPSLPKPSLWLTFQSRSATPPAIAYCRIGHRDTSASRRYRAS